MIYQENVMRTIDVCNTMYFDWAAVLSAVI